MRLLVNGCVSRLRRLTVVISLAFNSRNDDVARFVTKFLCGWRDRCQFAPVESRVGCIDCPHQRGLRQCSGVSSRTLSLQIAIDRCSLKLVQLPARRTSASCGRSKRPPQAGERAVDTGAGQGSSAGVPKWVLHSESRNRKMTIGPRQCLTKIPGDTRNGVSVNGVARHRTTVHGFAWQADDKQ